MLSDSHLLDSRILVVDDNQANVLFVQHLLTYAGYTCIRSTNEPREVLPIFREWHPHLIILDLHMPGMNGFEVMAQLRGNGLDDELTPILVFTADATADARRKALEAGAADFLTKPGEATEILLRVRNFLRIRHLYQQLAQQNHSLEALVFERTLALQRAQEEIVERLGRAAEYRDDDTGEHARRVGLLSARIAAEMGLDNDYVRRLELAAAMHDIGKIGVPDHILLKRGKLEEHEMAIMRKHPEIGASVLSGSTAPVLMLAEEINLSHHERWDGSGYPSGLKGLDIPLSGRIVAVADTFDALISARPYKDPMPIRDALEIISTEAGRCFDPEIVRCFLRIAERDIQDGECMPRAA